MPNYDGTGPQGKGPLSGKGMGRCNQNRSYNRGQNNRGFGRKMNQGLRRGFCRGQMTNR